MTDSLLGFRYEDHPSVYGDRTGSENFDPIRAVDIDGVYLQRHQKEAINFANRNLKVGSSLLFLALKVANSLKINLNVPFIISDDVLKFEKEMLACTR